jgi:chromosome segregation ATPase
VQVVTQGLEVHRVQENARAADQAAGGPMSTEREQDLAEHRARFHPMSERFRSSAHDFRAGHDAATARAQERIAVLEGKCSELMAAVDNRDLRVCDKARSVLYDRAETAERANATLAAELAEAREELSTIDNARQAAWTAHAAAEAREAALKVELQRARDRAEVCWHCHDMLGELLPKCDNCPEPGDCDIEGCEEPGCAADRDPTRQQRIDKL